MTQRICVFCGSRSGNDPAFHAAAEATGRAIAERGLGLVYGGGSVGLMGTVARACMAAGGEVLGVIPGGLFAAEVAYQEITELYTVNSMHERKAKMAALSDAVLALPGGAGTLDELMEAFTWRQIGLHAMPLGVLNTGGFYRPLLAHLEATVRAGFLDQRQLDALIVDDDPRRAVEQLQASIGSPPP